MCDTKPQHQSNVPLIALLHQVHSDYRGQMSWLCLAALAAYELLRSGYVGEAARCWTDNTALSGGPGKLQMPARR